MAQNYTRQSTLSDGDTITASLFNDEYNQLVNAFTYSSTSASSTGHRHDGSSGQGGNIFKIGDLDFLNKIEVDSTNNRWGFYVEVSSAAVEQIRIQDGAIVPVTTNDIDLGTASLQFKDLYIDGTANVDSLTLTSGATVTTILDEDDLSSDSATALVTQQSVKAYVDSQVTAQDLDFQADSGGALSIDLDSETLTFTGGTGIDTSGSDNAVTFAIDSTVATLTGTQTLTNKTLTSPDVNTPDIDGGTIDGTVIGGTTPAAVSATTVSATGNITVSGTVDGRDVATDGTKLDGIESGATADQTAAEIRTLVESATDSNVFTDADHTKLDGIEANATADQTDAEIRAAVEAATDSNVFTDADHSKLDGIEAGADVTDTANVTAAGALMDSEVTNLAQVKAFDSADYATAAQGTTADSALQNVVEDTTPQLGGNLDLNSNDITGTGNIDVTGNVDASLDLLVGGAVAGNAGTRTINVGTAGSVAGGVQIWAGTTQTSFLQFGDDSSISANHYRGYLSYNHSTDTLALGAAGSTKVSVTSTGIDVTGGITSSGNLEITSAVPKVILTDSNNPNGQMEMRGANTEFVFDFDPGNAENNSQMDFKTDGSRRLLVKSTGIDVSGSVTADGLTVDGSAAFNLGSGEEVSIYRSTDYAVLRLGASSTDHWSFQEAGTNSLYIGSTDSGTAVSHLKLDNNGDISFYEDTGTTAKLFWDASAESLGIGTSSPTSGGGLTLSSSTTAQGFIDFKHTVDGDSGFIGNAKALITGATTNQLGVRGGTNGIAFSVAATEAMRIDASGNVGIGSSSPSEQLHVSGALRISNNSADTYLGFGSNSDNYISTASGGATIFRELSTERMRIDSSGNLQLGNTTGSRRLNVFSDTDRYTVDLRNESGYNSGELSGIVFSGRYDSSNNVTDMASIGGGKENTTDGNFGGRLSFFTRPHNGSDTERMRIDSRGAIGFGTTPPSDTHTGWNQFFIGQKASLFSENATGTHGLDGTFITDNLYVDSDTGSFANIETNQSSAYRQEASEHIWYSQASGSAGAAVTLSEKMRLDASGNLLVGTTDTFPGGGDTNTGVSLHNTGAVTASRDGDFAGRFNRKTSNGDIVQFNKDGTTVGSIGCDSNSNFMLGQGDTGLSFQPSSDRIIPRNTDGSGRDAAIDLGGTGNRFKDLYLSGGAYLGGTASANYLDDYEEGTWTVDATGAGNLSGTGLAYEGKYTKIGNTVICYLRITTTSDDLQVTSYQLFSGLPFTISKAGTGTVITEDIDQFSRQGFAAIGGSNFAISKCGSATGTTAVDAMVVYMTT